MGEVAVALDHELLALAESYLRVASGRGAVVLVDGAAGSGKSTVISSFRKSLAELTGGDSAIFAVGYCYEVSEGVDSYEPFKEILGDLAQPAKRPRVAGLLGELTRELAPDLLGLIPGLGLATAAARIGTHAAAVYGKWKLGADEQAHAEFAESMVAQYISVFTALAERDGPLVLVVDDAHWIDRASALLIVRLARLLEDKRILLIVCHRSGSLSGSALYKILPDLFRLSTCRTLSIGGFTEDQVRSYIEQRYQTTSFPPELPDWIRRVSGGLPMFVAQYLGLLEDRSLLRSSAQGIWLTQPIVALDDERLASELPMPRSVQEVLNQRIEGLEEGRRRLLILGSVQGYQFMSSILSESVSTAADDILRELRQIELNDRLIRVLDPERWARKETELYSFEHALLRHAFYGRLGRLERLRYHGVVGRALTGLIGRLAAAGQDYPRRLLIEASAHYRLAEEYREAARYGLRAAQSCYAENAFGDAADLCERVVSDLGKADQEHDEDALTYAQAMQLLLVTAGPRNSTGSVDGELFHFSEIIESASRAALRAGDDVLQAQLRLYRGRDLIVTGQLDRAVAEFAGARQDLHDVGDTFGEIHALVDLGHHRMGLEPDQAVADLHAAVALLADRRGELEATVPASTLEQLRFRLQVNVGVSEFDLGRLGPALAKLEGEVRGSPQAKTSEPISVNFLAQVLIAIGLFERAESALNEAIRVGANQGLRGAVSSAYSRALLGKLYLEWDRNVAAFENLQAAWVTIQETPDNSILPLVANYFAESLMQVGTDVFDLASARSVLELSLHHSTTNHFMRSTVVALCLLARIAEMDGNGEEALRLSGEAAEKMWSAGMLPAVRSEEIYLQRYEILRYNGDRDEARIWLQRAHRIVEQKAQTLDDAEMRRCFLTKVKLSAAIIAAAHEEGLRPPVSV